MRLRMAKSGMFGKSINWRGAAEGFYSPTIPLLA
jgi:hypothetical protein